MTTPKDTDIREALRRKYANVPQMRSPLRLPRGGEKKRFPLHRWWFPASAVAASIIVAFFLWPNSPAVVEQPVVAEVVEQPTPEAPKASDSSEYSEYSDNSEKSEPSEPVKPKRTRKVQEPKEEPLLAEAEPVKETPARDNREERFSDPSNPYLQATAQLQDLRSRGERLDREVAMLLQH